MLKKYYPLTFSVSILLLQIFLFSIAERLFHQRLDYYLHSTLARMIGDAMELDSYYRNLQLLSRGITDLLVVAFITTKLGWWSKIGLASVLEWRNLQACIIPLLITFSVLHPLVMPAHLFSLMKVVVINLFSFGFLYLVVEAFVEEVFNRGIIQTALMCYGVIPAIVLSSVLFGLMHLSHWVAGTKSMIDTILLILATTAYGFGASVLRIHTKTIAPLIVLHALHNSFIELANLNLYFLRLEPNGSSWSWITHWPIFMRYIYREYPGYLMGLYGLYLLRRISKSETA
jgi:membrane protease YdiL (CAAX protease family)